MEKLSAQDQEFVKEVALTDNATQAVKKAYKSITTDGSARAKGSQLLTNINIATAVAEVKKSLADSIPDELLTQKHLELLNQKQVAYFVFPKKMLDVEIEDKVNGAGFEVINIKEGEKGKYAFYSNNDANAIKAGLDMSYKLKGAYSDEATKPPVILMPVLVKFLNIKDDDKEE